MNILGLSFDYHDSAAALLCDGSVVAAVQEERLSRRKHDAEFPVQSIAACLKLAGVSADAIDAVVHYEDPLLKFDRLALSALRAGRNGLPFLWGALEAWLRNDKFNVQNRIAAHLKLAPEKVLNIQHHQAHAASAFFCSPFERATVLTLDGVGEFDTATVHVGRGAKLERCGASQFPHSIGLFYSAMTAFLGFEVNEGEYKVMGMAGFGQPRHTDKIRTLLDCRNGKINLNLRYFDVFAPNDSFAKPALHALLGSPREPESPFVIDAGTSPEQQAIYERSLYFADVAASVQKVTEDAILDLVEHAVRTTGVREVAMAGGVALNSLANGRIQRELNLPLYVQPAAGDAGGALGAALFHHCRMGFARPAPLENPFLGLAYDTREIRAALDEARLSAFRFFESEQELVAKVARLLADGAVVGWMQGRFEWGPRALGNRSILASPMRADMQRIINEKIKFREPFRPFAPAVLAEEAQRFFEIGACDDPMQVESFMLSVCKVKPEKVGEIPAVTHVDGTARVQLVHPTDGRPFRRLIESFAALTGVPILLNTSFNRRGEPIVSSPTDALKTFLWSDLDYLVMNNCLVQKENI